MSASQDQKNIGLLLWIGTFFFGFIPGLILFFVKADDAFIKEQSKEALNWSITAFIISLVLAITVVGAFLIPVIGLVHLVFCILGVVAMTKGDNFKVPFAIRLIK